MTRIQANLLLTVIAMIWGSAFVAQSHGMADVGPMMFTGVRFLIGALVVLPLIVLERRRPDARPLRRADMAAFLSGRASKGKIGRASCRERV